MAHPVSEQPSTRQDYAMNTTTYRNGCHDRKPFKESVPVQDGHFMDGVTRTPRMVSSPFRMSKACEYTKTTLGQADKGCTGCKWRAVP